MTKIFFINISSSSTILIGWFAIYTNYREFSSCHIKFYYCLSNNDAPFFYVFEYCLSSLIRKSQACTYNEFQFGAHSHTGRVTCLTTPQIYGPATESSAVASLSITWMAYEREGSVITDL